MRGVRPPLPAKIAQYDTWQLRIRPGITGVWHVSARPDGPFDEAVRLDLVHIENW